MSVICPKCRHVRPADATNPAWECPACGICYAKFKERDIAPARHGLRERIRPAHVQEEEIAGPHGRRVGLLVKLLLLIAVGWGIMQAFEHRNSLPADETVVAANQESAAAPEEPNAVDLALKVAPADVSMMREVGQRLEASCARNKWGMSEQECIAMIRANGEACAASVAQRYPGKMHDSGQLVVVTQAYVRCIFDR